MSNEEAYVTVEEAAELLGLSTRQVNRYGKGKPPLIRTRGEGRRLLYLRSDVLALAQSFALPQPPSSNVSAVPEAESQEVLQRSELRPLSELAAELSVSVHSLRNAVAGGRLWAEKLGPIYVTSRQDVERYLAARRPRKLPRQQS